ncbi:MAG: hypothetical protein JXB26_16695 [Candidatus Aminicenantes bacterium]|nr:hypothetical protein [Candidatus Aminicenantes bacterium]
MIIINMGFRKETKNVILILIIAIGFYGGCCKAEEFVQVPGLIDIRTDFSDGAHTLDFIISLARKRGFHVLFINDHDRYALEYGVWPLRNLLKKRVERSSINKKGAERYLAMIHQVETENPDMILIPGSESSPFYFWKGSLIRRNLTVCNWERHLLVVGLERPSDYKNLPAVHNDLESGRKPGALAWRWVIIIGVILASGYFVVKKRGFLRYLGVLTALIGSLILVNHCILRTPRFNIYRGDPGIKPYQSFIDYVISYGGMVFWNHPETRSGRARLGPVYRDTPPYPEVLLESHHYTGFSALYGDTTTLTDPGGIWDKVLLEYCEGRRKRPVWGISSADFHEEGSAGEKLGNFPTIFLVREISKAEILEAMKLGRMYAYRGDVDLPPLILEEFVVSGENFSRKGIMGAVVVCKTFPRIGIKVTEDSPKKGGTVHLNIIRSGRILKTASGDTPLEIDFQDDILRPGELIYYRLDIQDGRKRRIISNPVFVEFK